MIFEYDDSLQGLYTALFEAFTAHPPPTAILPAPAQINLIDKIVTIETCEAKALRIYSGVTGKISDAAAYNIELSRLSGDPGAGMALFGYLKKGFALGRVIDDHLADEHVAYVLGLVRRVQRECHRMLGLLRFRRLTGGALYAAMEPDCNIISLMQEHFCDRMKQEDFIIHDVKRAAAVFHKSGDAAAYPVDLHGSVNPVYAESEAFIAELWKTYFTSISIKQRENKKLQMQFMPKKYWKHIIEMQ